MSDLKQEKEENEGSRTWYVIGWILLIAALVALGLMLGPCDPAPEPVPAQHDYNSSGLPEVDLNKLDPIPAVESTGSTGCEVTGFETSSGETTGK